jgi:hypothetical protein
MVRCKGFKKTGRCAGSDARNDGIPPIRITYLLMLCCGGMTGIGLVRGLI